MKNTNTALLGAFGVPFSLSSLSLFSTAPPKKPVFLHFAPSHFYTSQTDSIPIKIICTSHLGPGITKMG